MKTHCMLSGVIFCLAVVLVSCQPARQAEQPEKTKSTKLVEIGPGEPCLGCHVEATPEIVSQWQESKHSKVGVKCYLCHFAEETNPKRMEHNGFSVVKNVGGAICQRCHPQNGPLLYQNAISTGKHP